MTLWRRISPNFRFERELQSKTILNWNTLLIVDISKFQPFIFKYIYGSDEWHLQFVKWREILDAESWTKTYKKTWACSKIFTMRMTKLCNKTNRSKNFSYKIKLSVKMKSHSFLLLLFLQRRGKKIVLNFH